MVVKAVAVAAALVAANGATATKVTRSAELTARLAAQIVER